MRMLPVAGLVTLTVLVTVIALFPDSAAADDATPTPDSSVKSESPSNANMNASASSTPAGSVGTAAGTAAASQASASPSASSAVDVELRRLELNVAAGHLRTIRSFQLDIARETNTPDAGPNAHDATYRAISAMYPDFDPTKANESLAAIGTRYAEKLATAEKE